MIFALSQPFWHQPYCISNLDLKNYNPKNLKNTSFCIIHCFRNPPSLKGFNLGILCWKVTSDMRYLVSKIVNSTSTHGMLVLRIACRVEVQPRPNVASRCGRVFDILWGEHRHRKAAWIIRPAQIQASSETIYCSKLTYLTSRLSCNV